MKIGLYLDEVSLQVLKKGVFVSCEPEQKIQALAPGLIEERMSEIGQIYLVADMNKQPRGKAKLADAFITTFGEPDKQLLELMGFADDVPRFQKEYSAFYEKQNPDFVMNAETELFVTIYEPVSDS